MAGAGSTYGWDVVVATATDVVNAGLAPVADQPFDETVPGHGASVRVWGVTGGWQVTTGGSGALVSFAVPCALLSLSDGTRTAGFRDGRFEVQGTLRLDPAADGAAHELVVVAGPGAVTVVGASFPQDGFDGFAVYATAAMQAWLDAQASFPYVLARVRLAGTDGGSGDPDGVLTPTSATYAYADAPHGGGVLGILATVAGGATAEALLQEVAPDAVAAGGTAVLVGVTVLARLLDGAAGAVVLPGSSGSSCRVGAPLTAPVTLAPASSREGAA